MSEIFPSRIRKMGIAIGTAAQWLVFFYSVQLGSSGIRSFIHKRGKISSLLVGLIGNLTKGRRRGSLLKKWRMVRE
jgi:hypothetical protein